MRKQEIDMSIWNHRLVDMSADNGGDPMLALREVFYDDDGKPMGHTEPFMCGETMTEMLELLERLHVAMNHPILKPEDFVRNKVTETKEGETK
jgi:hypothetical protein